MNIKKALIFGFFTAFLILGVVSMQRAMPDSKEDRIYLAIKEYSPYIVEKRIGGLTILDKRDDKIKEKPDSSDFYHRLDELEKAWGKTHLIVENNELIIMGENNQSKARIMIENEKERAFLKKFFGI
ncbi:hypothetical protein Suden_1978 [Sulfurimonas denitrificans DSM 1251]|uniref:Uncharacterized protein n=1 Tax=Sulfurimonas denitrificans (strain ATCC 33889 / DSM 1251) TaxID=326298 RepID=Q30P29_SULDN|nr:hypothetical protein [Sulfurimonas denitrificans]ABB45252.1 hypothetical protein Suden_1978 [Sulfurimonas denitrificans DSM 1251]